MVFSTVFSDDPIENQRSWERHRLNPIIPAGEPWNREFVAPCSLIEDKEGLVLYAEGGVKERESIGAYTSNRSRFPAGDWTPRPDNPILVPAAIGFDRGSVFDPAVTAFAGAVRLYYSATATGAHDFALAEVGSTKAGESEFIGMAIASPSGVFERSATPVLAGRCPWVIQSQGILYLFYVKVVRGGYRIFLARSADGVEFVPVHERPVLTTGDPGAWDSFTVTTPKVFHEGEHFAMLYAGDAQRIDDPTGIGIAVSDDLVTWRKHPGNPVFAPGVPKEFDSVSVASAVPYEIDREWYILYAGSDRYIDQGLHSQIGLARLCK
jgi:predicted GH43/DUF377 family glycosyl hydrolase